MMLAVGILTYAWLGLAVVVGGFLAFRTMVECFLTPRDPGGDPTKGLMVFAESTRWLSVPWGKRTCARGLRKAGFTGEFRYWSWHAAWRAWLVLPLLADGTHTERRARELATFLREQRLAHPERPMHLMGYSAGGFIAVRALELLAAEAEAGESPIEVDSLVLLAAAFWPGRDLNPASRCVRGVIVNSTSPIDVIVGLGTCITGTCDRHFSPSIGSRGYRGQPCDKVVSLRWKASLIRQGHIGSHFTAAATNFIEKTIAPIVDFSPH